MTVKLLTELHLEFLSLKGGCTDLSEYAHVETPHCWKSHVLLISFSTDKDECISGENACTDGCINTVGSFFCRCSDPSNAVDIDGKPCKRKDF